MAQQEKLAKVCHAAISSDSGTLGGMAATGFGVATVLATGEKSDEKAPSVPKRKLGENRSRRIHSLPGRHVRHGQQSAFAATGAQLGVTYWDTAEGYGNGMSEEVSEDAVLLPQMLKKRGYHNAMVGKWNLGLESPNTPTEGFRFLPGIFRGYDGLIIIPIVVSK